MGEVNLRRLPDDWTSPDEALLQAIDDATATPIYIPYRLAAEWFEGIHTVLDELEAHGVPHPVVGLVLIEHFLKRLDQASGAVDDSDGGMVEVGERIRQMFIDCSANAGLGAAETSARASELAALEFWPLGP